MQDFQQGELFERLKLGAASRDPDNILVKRGKPGVCIVVIKIRMQAGRDNTQQLWGTVDKKTAEIQQPGSAYVVCRWKDTDMTLNKIIGYRVTVVKTIQFTADTHVKNVEVVHLDLRKGAPDMQIIIKLRKNTGRG